MCCCCMDDAGKKGDEDVEDRVQKRLRQIYVNLPLPPSGAHEGGEYDLLKW